MTGSRTGPSGRRFPLYLCSWGEFSAGCYAAVWTDEPLGLLQLRPSPRVHEQRPTLELLRIGLRSSFFLGVRVLELTQPVVRVGYAFEQKSGPDLIELVDAFVRKSPRG